MDVFEKGESFAHSLMHAEKKRPYDPVKRREYYLRTRQLKGRRKGVSSLLKGGSPEARKVLVRLIRNQTKLRKIQQKIRILSKNSITSKAAKNDLEDLKYQQKEIVDQIQQDQNFLNSQRKKSATPINTLR